MNIQHASSPSSRGSRRGFLKTVGLVTGGLALQQFPLSLAKGETLAHLPSVGMLLPHSSRYPDLGENLTAGLKLALDEAASRAGLGESKIFVEDLGTSPTLAIRRAHHLLEEKKVDLLVGTMNPNIAAELHDILESSRAYLIVADAGANMVRNIERTPRVFYNSLGYWRSSFAMGEWTVRNTGRKAFVISSFYESGYDALHAFRLGVERAGGEIVETHISHIPPDPADFNRVLESISSAKPDVVYALYSGEEANEFINMYASSLLAGRIPLLGSPFMLDERFLTKSGSAAQGIRSCHSWAPGIRTAENDSFMSGYELATGRRADAFAALGYDTGKLIIEAVRAAGGNKARMGDALRTMRFRGPRGLLRMDPETHSTTTPFYVREVHRVGGEYMNTVLEEFRTSPDNHNSIAAWRSEERTGWLNTYLSA